MTKKSENTKPVPKQKRTVGDVDADLKSMRDQIRTLQNQQTITVKIKKLCDEATIPTYVTDGSAGMDIFATSREYDYENSCQVYHTGLSIEIPKGYVGLLFPKSGICKHTQYLTNCIGVIDSDYRGEVVAKFKADWLHVLQKIKENSIIMNWLLSKFVSRTNTYETGEAIVQMIIIPYPKINLLEVEELSSTVRGDRGFGEMDLIQDEKA